MRQWAALLLAGLVTACAAQIQESAGDSGTGPQPAALAMAPICRLSPDGGPVLADRGIGGTGAPAAKFTPAAAGSAQVADRGIGGTGIVGVITGFASVCVNGLEVAYDDNVPVDLNGTPTPASALRAGQVVVIQADGPVAAPHARTMSLRQEVSGRIEAVELGSGLLTIAGIPVSVPAGTWGANRFGLGDWVAVSGVPQADGVVVASRLDVAPPGAFSAHGRIAQDGPVASIGRLTLPGSLSASLREGESVIVTGTYAGGRKQPTAVTSDRLFADPARFFGPSVDHLVMQAFVRVASGEVWLNGRKMAASANLRGHAGPDGVAVVSLERRPDGSFSATQLRATDFRVHAVPGASASRSPGLGVPAPLTRHVSLPPARPDGSSAATLTNYEPTATAPYLATMPTQPFVTTPAPAGSLQPGTVASGPAPVVIAPTITPLVSSMPAVSAPSGVILPATISVPVIAPSILAIPSAGAGSAPGMVPAAVTLPTAAPVLPPAIPPLAIPPTGMPQIESVYAPVMSSNAPVMSSGGVLATSSVVAAARGGTGAVLASQTVHARSSVPGLTTRPTISLVTTIGGATPGPSPTAAASNVLSTIRTSPTFAIPGSGRTGRH